MGEGLSMLHRFDAKSAQCAVFTFKEGLLSPLAHDLQIHVRKFEIEVDDATHAIRATFAADSLRVVGAMRSGQLAPGELSTANKREIESNIKRYVLEVTRHPRIEFISSAVEDKRGTHVVKGHLTLHGVERPIKLTVRREEYAYAAEHTLHQPDFGITPFSAMLGTLKVSPMVKVQVRVPVPQP